MSNIFKVKREERFIAITLISLITLLNALLILSHYDVYTLGAKGGFWTLFTKNFRVSGYDNWSWITLSCLRTHFETIRHPLYLSLLYPFYQINRLIITYAGINCAVFITALFQLISSFYSIIFMYRINREVIGLSKGYANLFTLFFFSFAHILLPTIVPDHFIISLMLLLMTLYIVGNKMKTNTVLTVWQTFWINFLTTGIAASNYAKTFLAAIFTNKHKIFSIKYITIGLLLPLILLLCIRQMQYYTIEVPQKAETEKIIEARNKKDPNFLKKYSNKRNKWLNNHNAIKQEGNFFEKLVDFKTPRLKSLYENFFGESIQLHQDYLLKDVSWDRPIFVKYNCIFNYIIEIVIVCLFVIGIISSIRERFFQMLLLWFSVDIIIHVILGFALNEVYITTAGWGFIIPISIGFIVSRSGKKLKTLITTIVLMLTTWLYIYNVSQIISYFI